MGMLDGLGIESKIPSIDFSGFLSSTWVYVIILCVVGFFLIIGLVIFLFFRTYNKRMILFENISGQGYVPVKKLRARVIKLGVGGGELLKTFSGGHYFSNSGRKMGKNTFWYAKGQDGYWYNILVGDLDSKKAMLDIDPIDRDVRMFHIALDRLSHQTYGKTSFMEKYAVHLLLFVFLMVMVFGLWILIGKMAEVTAPLALSTENAIKIQEANDKTLEKLNLLIRSMGYNPDIVKGGSGIVPVET